MAQGKREIEHEKHQFSALVKAMYPRAVSERLLLGESQIVFDVPQTAVFFSDIYEFTQISNSVTSAELIEFMGYTFGVMDGIADWARVHKACPRTSGRRCGTE